MRIDDANTKVFSRDRGLLVLNPDMNLEHKARMQALGDAHAAAKQSQVLAIARTNAETSLRQLLTPMGYEKVEFAWKKPGING